VEETVKVKIKKLHKDAVVPQYIKDGDACMDLVAVSEDFKFSEGYIEYDIGLALEIPEGYVGLVFPRSSISKKGLVLCNSIGVIDSGYRGSIKVRFKEMVRRRSNGFCLADRNRYDVGEKVAQLMIMPYPLVEFEVVEELSETDRGDGGFGSTDISAGC
jgi:dUTP pyrophosphatase